MFIRTKKRPNGKIAIQLVESLRKNGKITQRVVRHVGTASSELELQKLKEYAVFIKCEEEHKVTPRLISPDDLARQIIEEKEYNGKRSNDSIKIENIQSEQDVIFGIHEVYGKVFNQIGFDNILNNPGKNKSSRKIIKDLVLARIANPTSKRKTLSMLEKDFGIEHNLDYVYKVMDKLDDKVIEKIQNKAYNYAKRMFGNQINVVFFDTTTLYFESFEEDELKRNGYSKDCKFNQPQVLFALLVTEEGMPIGYEVFPGNEYEGGTLIPILNKLKRRYELGKIVFVADSGLFNKKNIESLEENNFEYIVGARIKNMNKNMKDQILNKDNYTAINASSKASSRIETNNYSIGRFKYNDNSKLIVTHSATRARKDKHDRNKNIEKLIEKSKKNDSISNLISNYGYKKYIQVTANESIKIDNKKIKEDEKWDGLHGIITNAKDMPAESVISHYRGLWQVEESFRINKHDLKIRPIFHWTPERIKSHIALVFMSFTCIRVLTHRVGIIYKKMSPEQIKNELMHVKGHIIRDSETNKYYCIPSKLSSDVKRIYKLMKLKYATNCFCMRNIK